MPAATMRSQWYIKPETTTFPVVLRSQDRAMVLSETLQCEYFQAKDVPDRNFIIRSGASLRQSPINMRGEPLPVAFIKTAIDRYEEYLRHIFPIPCMDESLVEAYIHAPKNFDEVGDTRLFQLPYVTGLCTMIPLGKLLKELNSQKHSGDSINQLKDWMSDTLLAIWSCKSSLPLVRALLLAALCYQYEGEFSSALQCFEKAKSMFHGLILDLGGLERFKEGLAFGELHDLALASWDFSNFMFLDHSISSQVSIPLFDFDPAVVREKFGKQTEDVLRQKWACKMFKFQVASLQCSCTALEHLPEMVRSIKALQIPPNPTPGSTIYPVDYFESVQLVADTCCWAVSAYHFLPEKDRQKLLPEPSQFANSYTRFVIETLKQSQESQSLERRRLMLFWKHLQPAPLSSCGLINWTKMNYVLVGESSSGHPAPDATAAAFERLITFRTT
ncbi:hypothetical protein ACJA88_014436 [Fusarium oxysporum]